MFILIWLADLIDGVLDALGGIHWLFARRYIMVFLMGVTVSVAACLTHGIGNWWLGFLVLPAMGTFTLGYPSGQNWGRGLWLFIQAIALSLGLAVLGHLGIYWDFLNVHVHLVGRLACWITFSIFVVLAGLLGGIYKNWYAPLGDLVTGCYLGLLSFFVC